MKSHYFIRIIHTCLNGQTVECECVWRMISKKNCKKTEIKLWSERIWHHCTYVNLILYISINTIRELGTWNWGHSILDTVNVTWYAICYSLFIYFFFLWFWCMKKTNNPSMQFDLLTTLVAINFRSETSRPQEK